MDTALGVPFKKAVCPDDSQWLVLLSSPTRTSTLLCFEVEGNMNFGTSLSAASVASQESEPDSLVLVRL